MDKEFLIKLILSMVAGVVIFTAWDLLTKVSFPTIVNVKYSVSNVAASDSLEIYDPKTDTVTIIVVDSVRRKYKRAYPVKFQ